MHAVRSRPGLTRRVAFAALVVVVVLLVFRGAFRPASDLAVFWKAGARFFAGADLYSEPGAHMPYRYAPGVAGLFVPLAGLTFGAARAIWSALCGAIVLGVALALDRRLGDQAPLAAPLAWMLFAQSLAQEIGYGQVDLLVLALALGAFALDDRDRPWSAGALIGLAAALKVAPVVLLLDAVWRRRWRPFAGAALAGVALSLLTAARFGIAGAIDQHRAWWTTQSSDASLMIDAVRNQSLWAMARSLGLGRPFAAAACVALLLAALSASRHRRLLLLASIPLVSAYGWPQLFVLVVPLLAVTLARGGAAAWVAGCAAGAVSLLGYDVAGPRVEDWAEPRRLLGVLVLIVFVAGRLAATERRELRTAASPRAS